MEIIEKRNKQLEEWAVKFHGMRIGSEVMVYNTYYGQIKDYDFTFPKEFIRVHVPNLGYDSEYAPHNVSLL